MLRCEVLPLAGFAEVAADWAALAARCSHAPFLELDFVQPLLAVFADGSQRVVRVRDAQGVLAVGVFARRGAMWETFQPSQTPIGCVVARADADWAQLLAAIARALPGFVVGVSATQQDPQFLQRARDGGAVSTLDYITTAWVDVDGSFEDYWNARGKNLRQNLRKQRRKLADDAVALQLDVVTEPAGVAEALADYGRLESAGWKAEGGTAIAVDNDQGRFYRSMLERFCARGRARVYRYRFDQRVVVVDLCIESADTLVVLKTTYDESIRSLSPASLMREEVFRQIWEQGRIRRIEFYGRMMDWHTRWSADSRTLYHVNWYRWPRMMRAAQRLTALSKAASSAARARRELSPAASAEATAAPR